MFGDEVQLIRPTPIYNFNIERKDRRNTDKHFTRRANIYFFPQEAKHRMDKQGRGSSQLDRS